MRLGPSLPLRHLPPCSLSAPAPLSRPVCVPDPFGRHHIAPVLFPSCMSLAQTRRALPVATLPRSRPALWNCRSLPMGTTRPCSIARASTVDGTPAPSVKGSALPLRDYRANIGRQASVLHIARSVSVGTSFAITAAVRRGVRLLAGAPAGDPRDGPTTCTESILTGLPPPPSFSPGPLYSALWAAPALRPS